MKRKVIEIAEDKCNGCGLCVPECHEGAIQIIEGKARLVSEIFCDGLGACLGHCPEGAITIVEKEAEPYDESKVIKSMLEKPVAVIEAHLRHLASHNETELLATASATLKENGVNIPIPAGNGPGGEQNRQAPAAACNCPGSAVIDRRAVADESHNNDCCSGELPMPPAEKSQLQHWPVQLHLVNPSASFFAGSDLVVLSTCSPVAFAGVQSKYIRNKAVVVACPKLDYTAPYTQKLADIFVQGRIRSVTVVIMEVPCCKGLMKIVLEARALSGRDDLQIEEHVITLDGKLKTINYV